MRSSDERRTFWARQRLHATRTTGPRCLFLVQTELCVTALLFPKDLVVS